jgi:hypothetical protein
VVKLEKVQSAEKGWGMAAVEAVSGSQLRDLMEGLILPRTLWRKAHLKSIPSKLLIV